jgi:DNA-binding LacI/PurR family transcriptional regulator
VCDDRNLSYILVMPSNLLQTVIEETGCSRATVYRALQGNSLVSANTREKVQTVAKRVGFYLNPLVGDWMARVRKPQTSRSRHQIVYLAGHDSETYAATPLLSKTWKGAKKRATELGFSIKIWHVGSHNLELAKIPDQLRKSDIHGVIISRFPPNSPPLSLPWEDLSLVAIGFSAQHPPIHTVSSHGYETMRHCLEDLRLRGYKRPGYVGSIVAETLGGSRHTADFLALRESFPDAVDIPLLRLRIEAGEGKNKKEFLRWLLDNRPDVILSGGIIEYRDWLMEAGLHIPEDVGFFFLGIRQGNPAHLELTGIPQPSTDLGRSAVDLLATLIYHGERGLPLQPDIIQTLVPLIIEGKTAWPRR